MIARHAETRPHLHTTVGVTNMRSVALVEFWVNISPGTRDLAERDLALITAIQVGGELLPVASARLLMLVSQVEGDATNGA